MPENPRKKLSDDLRTILGEAHKAVDSYEIGEMGLKYLYSGMLNCKVAAIDLIEDAAGD